MNVGTKREKAVVDHVLADLETRGFSVVDYPPDLREAVVDIAKVWAEACVCPEEHRRALTHDDGKKYDDGGWEISRDPQKPTHDLKQMLHLPFEHWPRKFQQAQDVGSTVLIELLRSTQTVRDLLRPVIYDLAETFEQQLNIPGILDEIREHEDSQVVRLLDYFPGRLPGDCLAKAHADKGALTMYLWQNHGGVEYMDRSGKWQVFNIEPGKMVITADLQFQLRTLNLCKGLPHRVVADDYTAKHGRRSIVYFMDFGNTPRFDKKNNGRQQDLPPGWNFNLPFHEFRRYFRLRNEKSVESSLWDPSSVAVVG